MRKNSKTSKRPKAYEQDFFGWHWGRIKPFITVKGEQKENPGKNSAIFLVHGIGNQMRTETAALLRSGFEDALVQIAKWQDHERSKPNSLEKYNLDGLPSPANMAPPYISEGFWADYPEISKTFKKDYENFSKDERTFFEKVWQKRIYSKIRTIGWVWWQSVRLVFILPFTNNTGCLAWLSYFPLLIIVPNRCKIVLKSQGYYRAHDRTKNRLQCWH
jgi:hypothetical protein